MLKSKLTKLALATTLLVSLFFPSLPSAKAENQELDIYNEWFSKDSQLNNDRPFFLIKNINDFQKFWAKSNFKGFPPHIDFEKYMVFVWAPGLTRKDCSQTEIEKLVYKNGSYLVLMNFKGYDKYTLGPKKKPVKAAIFPKTKDTDVFVFKKIYKGWESYDWQPVYAIWDMSEQRRRPFEYVYLDKENKVDYQMASISENLNFTYSSPNGKAKENSAKTNEPEIYTPKIGQVSMPRALPNSTSIGSANTSPTPSPKPTAISTKQAVSEKAPPKATPQTTTAPINIGSTPAAKTNTSSKQENAPGMGEDPLFGSEFDITF